jgi:hypothetical protein
MPATRAVHPDPALVNAHLVSKKKAPSTPYSSATGFPGPLEIIRRPLISNAHSPTPRVGTPSHPQPFVHRM